MVRISSDRNSYNGKGVLNIYGREFDEVKKYINGIKYAHVVTYDKKDNVPDTLVKDLAWMLGFDGVDFLSDIDLNKSFYIKHNARAQAGE